MLLAGPKLGLLGLLHHAQWLLEEVLGGAHAENRYSGGRAYSHGRVLSPMPQALPLQKECVFGFSFHL